MFSLKNLTSFGPNPISPIRKRENPFSQANPNQGTPNQVTPVGVNQPLRSPLFLGYRDDKPIYAGSRLYLLY
jgi:hypothetical protein